MSNVHCYIPAMMMAAAALLAGVTAESQGGQRPEMHVVLAGDSTVTDDAGWGKGFAQCLRENVTVTNLARGGRSSRSFRDEGHWRAVLDAKPTHVLIQFGHNDEPGKGPERETDPSATFRDNIARYVDEAREAGAQPVLVTPLARRRWTPEGRFAGSSLEPYADAVKAVAAEKGVPLLDLHARSIDFLRSLGQKATAESIEPIKDDGGHDQTHLNEWGGKLFGMMVADMLRREVSAFDAAWKWNGIEFPDVREGKEKDRAVTRRVAGELTAQGAGTIRVAQDGSGDFRTVQEAIAAVPDNNTDRTIIDIAPGLYYGPIIVGPSKHNVTFKGHGVGETVLTYGLNVKAPLSEDQGYYFNGCGVTAVGDGFMAEDLTFQNTSGDWGQAMALRIQSDRAVVRDCELLGWQDTLLTHSKRQYFENCHIEGRVDFIYGSSTVVFESCTIKSKNGGYVTAANTPQEHPVGMVFRNCKLTSDDGVPAYLGRPWRPYASVAYINCEMGSHIRPEGWDNWGKVENEQTARFTEFRSTGPGANPSQRVGWSKQLTAEEAEAYATDKVLAGDDGWSPTRR